MRHFLGALFSSVLMVLSTVAALAGDVDRFAGSYAGASADTLEGEVKPRDIEVDIKPLDEGFTVAWRSISYKDDGEIRESAFVIEFVPSQRDAIYGSAMKTNIFGKQVPLDPLKGEPFTWARFDGDTISVFTLFISEAGDYDLQEYHRTLVDGGLDLLFRRVKNGVPEREVTAFLEKQS